MRAIDQLTRVIESYERGAYRDQEFYYLIARACLPHTTVEVLKALPKPFQAGFREWIRQYDLDGITVANVKVDELPRDHVVRLKELVGER
jgi:hypothetical protein